MRLRSAAAGETGSPEAADVSSSAASATQLAAVAAAGARGDAPRDIRDYELELIYSGESDGEADSKEAKAKQEPELAKPEPTKLASRITLSLGDRRDIFGSSDESDPPSPRQRRSTESELSHRNDRDGDAIMHQSPSDRDDPGVGTSIDTRQEAVDLKHLACFSQKEAVATSSESVGSSL